MKKFFILMAVAVMAAGASAQVVTSRTNIKSKSQTTWYVRLGVSADNLTNGKDVFEDESNREADDAKASVGSKAGMDLNFGFMKNIGKSGLYWGMELGLGTRGATLKQEGEDHGWSYKNGQYEEWTEQYSNKGSVMTWNLKYSPFILGYKYSITDDLKLDAHLGIFVSYDFAGGTKYDWYDGDSEKLSFSEIKKEDWDYLAVDAGMQIGIGAWWKKLNFDITYQRGFIPAAQIGVGTRGYYSTYHKVSVYSSNVMFRIGYAF